MIRPQSLSSISQRCGTRANGACVPPVQSGLSSVIRKWSAFAVVGNVSESSRLVNLNLFGVLIPPLFGSRRWLGTSLATPTPLIQQVLLGSRPALDDDVRDLMGAWLGTLAEWTHFATWTFSQPVSLAGAWDLGRKHLAWLCRWDVDNERGPVVTDEQTHRRDQESSSKSSLQAFAGVSSHRKRRGRGIMLWSPESQLFRPFVGCACQPGSGVRSAA